MTERYSVSIDSDELNNFIEEMENDVYENRSELFRKALKKFKDDYGDALKQLKDQDDSDSSYV
jgi:Arc/MetJ-type ribon-helix-helix transcriptional regulator